MKKKRKSFNLIERKPLGLPDNTLFRFSERQITLEAVLDVVKMKIKGKNRHNKATPSLLFLGGRERFN